MARGEDAGGDRPRSAVTVAATIRHEVREVLATTFNVDIQDLPQEVSIDNFERWTSLYHLALVVALEAQFDVMLSTDEIVEMTSESAIVEILAARSAG